MERISNSIGSSGRQQLFGSRLMSAFAKFRGR
jgi:hypothetical protein